MKAEFINSRTFEKSPLLKSYIEMNAIKGAFIYKDGNNYQVFEGDPETQIGLLAGEFSLRRDAIELRNKLNDLIKSV